MLGDWIVQGDFRSALPFPHVIIDNMFRDDIVSSLLKEFGDPTKDSLWTRYWNPIEKKYALNDFTNRPTTASVFEFLQTEEFVKKIADIISIPLLQNDPYLHGAGLHYHPRGGKLDMHLDYSVHPISGLERRVNLIVYLNETWEESWGGELELWNSEFTHCVKKILPTRNRAILFQTSDISYHGIPHPIMCPDTTGRRSLALYYMSPPTEQNEQRLKAVFRPLPNTNVSDEMRKLYEIRKTRNITEKDLQELNLYEQ